MSSFLLKPSSVRFMLLLLCTRAEASARNTCWSSSSCGITGMVPPNHVRILNNGGNVVAVAFGASRLTTRHLELGVSGSTVSSFF